MTPQQLSKANQVVGQIQSIDFLIQALFKAYGYKSLNIFRRATEIIAECNKRAMDMDETLRELDRAGF